MVVFAPNPKPYIHKPKAKRCRSTKPATPTAKPAAPRRLQRPRNEKGWIIPKPDTMGRKVYDMLLWNASPSDIMTALALTRNQVDRQTYRIRNPDKHRAQVAKWRSKKGQR